MGQICITNAVTVCIGSVIVTPVISFTVVVVPEVGTIRVINLLRITVDNIMMQVIEVGKSNVNAVTIVRYLVVYNTVRVRTM